MAGNKPSVLEKLRSEIEQCHLFTGILWKAFNLLEEYDRRIYALEQDNKRLQACNKDWMIKIPSLEKRLSEFSYKLADKPKQ